MKRIVVIAMVVAMGAIGVSVAASAVHAVAAWTASKSERMLVERATVQLPAPERAALESDLRQAVMQYSALAYAAAELGDSPASLTYDRVASEYRHALRVVLGGIGVADADCVGGGRSLTAQRFRRFDCQVVSDTLAIPTTELEDAADGDLPSVLQSEPRKVGPLVTWVRVRVTGTSSFKYE